MNRKILQKIIDALNQQQPDISYIRGILETLIESIPEEIPVNILRTVVKTVEKNGLQWEIGVNESDEERLEREAREKLNNIKDLI